MTFTVSDSPCMPDDASTMEMAWTAPLIGSRTITFTTGTETEQVPFTVVDPPVARSKPSPLSMRRRACKANR